MLRKRFWRAFFWEFIQNLPLLTGFMMALRLWPQGKLGMAVVCLLTGSVVGSLAIHLTESRIVEGYREPWRATITNMVVITLLMLLYAVYLSALWSRWWTDLFIGLVGGSGLRITQDLVSRSSLNLGRCALFGLSCAITLIGLRVFSANFPMGLGILAATTVATVAIVLTDYGPWKRDDLYQSTIL